MKTLIEKLKALRIYAVISSFIFDLPIKKLSEKDKLYKDWQQARNNFMMYGMKASYGDIRDREYNTEQANKWNKIISELSVKIINSNQK
jgi:hypothetical protein